MQAAALTWLAAKSMITEMTNGCTLVDSALTVSGGSEGGYASIPAAAALKRLGNRILNVYTQVPILDLQRQATFIVGTSWATRCDWKQRYRTWSHEPSDRLPESYLNGDVSNATNNFIFQGVVPWLAFVFSIETPGLANTGTGQVFLSQEYMDATNDTKNVFEWFASPDPYTREKIFQISPIPAIDVINEAFLTLTAQAIGGGLGNPCDSNLVVENTTGKLCEALDQGSLWGILETTDLPVKICYSVNDTVTAPSNFPESIFDNENVVLLNNILDIIKAEGDHFEANLRCSINAGSSFTLADPTNEDAPNLIQTFTESEMKMCSGAFSRSLMWSSLVVCSFLVALLWCVSFQTNFYI